MAGVWSEMMKLALAKHERVTMNTDDLDMLLGLQGLDVHVGSISKAPDTFFSHLELLTTPVKTR